MRIKRRSTISHWEEQPAAPSQSFPSICQASSGRLVACWRSSETKNGICGNQVLVSHSDDCGRSWSAPRVVQEAPVLDGRKGVFRMGGISAFGNRLLMTLCWVDTSRPERPFFNEANSGLLDCKVFLVFSDDQGMTWSVPRLLDNSPYQHQPTPTTGPAVILPNGMIAVQFELNLPFESTEAWRHLPVMKFTRNLGQSFEYYSIPAKDDTNRIFYWDQRPIALKNGTLVNFFWTWDNQENAYRNITSAVSTDCGKTWSTPLDTGIPGQAGPGFELLDGRLVVPVVDRTGIPRITLRISEDCGQSFTADILDVSGNSMKKQTAAQR